MGRALIWTPSIVILGFMVFAGISAALAQESSKSLIEKINRSTVTMITGDVYSTGALMAQDLATVVNSGIDRRLLPVLGIMSGRRPAGK